ncbi:MAG: biotin/lipoyl-containing protein [Novosphingobium sp.]
MSGKDTISDIERLIAEFEASGLRELHARRGDFEIYLSNDPDAPGLDGAPSASAPVASGRQAAAKAPAASAPAPASPAVAAPAPEASFPDGAVVVRAPYLGTFYRAPKPGAPAYVEVGQQVAQDSEMCLVEVMKLFTAVRASCSGTVHAVLANDGDMVAADQPLFVVIPA